MSRQTKAVETIGSSAVHEGEIAGAEHEGKERLPERHAEIIDFAEAGQRVRAKQFVEKKLFQDRERHGELAEDDPRLQMMQRIRERLYAATPRLQRGEARLIRSTEINAFVVKTQPDVFMYDGLLRQYVLWCHQNNEAPSEDAFAMVYAHELGHVQQGTEEITVDEEKSEKKYESDAEKKHKYQKHLNDEYDADRSGLQLMARAGYNPREGLKVLQFLFSLDEGTAIPTTHPRSPDRLRELVALVESPDTIMPNTDMEPTLLPAELVELLKGEPKDRPGTLLYRGEARKQLSEYMANATNIYDVLEVAQVAQVHRYFEEVDRVRESREVRDLYAKRLILENIRIALQALDSAFNGKDPFGFSFSFQDRNMPDSQTRYVLEEYGYGTDTPSELRSGRNIDIGTAKQMQQEYDREVKYLHEYIDNGIGRAQEKIVKLTVGEPAYDAQQQLVEMLQEIKMQVEHVVQTIDAQSIQQLVTNVDEAATESEWATAKATHNWLKTIDAQTLLQWCAENGTALFSRLRNPDKKQLTDALGGVARVDSRYEQYLPVEMLQAEMLDSATSRARFIEQSIYTHSDIALANALGYGHFGSDTEVFNEFHNSVGEAGGAVETALVQQLQQRYASLGEHGNTLASAMAHALLSGSFKDQEVVINIATKIWGFTAEAWVEHVAPLVGEQQFSANSLFLHESGMGGRLSGKGVPYMLGKFQSIESQCTEYIEGSIDEEFKKTQSTDELIAQISLVSDQVREEYLRKISTRLEAEDWSTSTSDMLRERLTPLLQQLSKKERKDMLWRTLGSINEEIPNLDAVLDYTIEASPEYAESLLFVRWEQLNTTIEPEIRLALFKKIYAHGDAFKNILQARYLPKYVELQHKLGKAHIKLHTEIHGAETVVDVLAEMTQGKFVLTQDDDENIFGDPALQAKVDALSEDEVVRLLDACAAGYADDSNEAYVNTFVTRLVARGLESIGIKGYKPFELTATFNTNEYSFDEVVAFVIAHIPKVFREDLLEQSSRAFAKTSDELVESGVVQQYKPIDKSMLEGGGVNINDMGTNVDEYAQRYNPTDKPFYEKQLPYHSRGKAKYVREYLSNNPVTTDRSRNIDARIAAVVHIVPELTDYRDLLFREIEADYVEEYGLETKGHEIVVPDGQPVSTEVIQALYDFYLRVIPLLQEQGQAQIWGRRANALFNKHLRTEVGTLGEELQRAQTEFPSASFVRDATLQKIGDSALVQTPDHARQVQNFTVDLQRQTDAQLDLDNQSQLEGLNVVIGALSRAEKKDFVLWTIGANAEPPKTLKAYGGLKMRSVEEMPAMIFGATEKEREQFLLRLFVGSNGLFEPQSAEDTREVNDFVERSFGKIFPDDAVEGVTGEARQMLQTIYETVLTEYDSYRSAKIFIGMVEALRSTEKISRGDTIVTLLGELGPVFIKVGQVLSETESAPGVPLLPDDIRTPMKGLKESAKRFSRLAAIFSLESAGEFDEDNPDRVVAVKKTLAAASIKQVSAALRADGKEVVEKVLRPSIEKHLEEDVRVLGVIVERLRQFTQVPNGIETLAANYVREEADFEREVANTQKIATTLKAYESGRVVRGMSVRTPEIYRSSKRHIQEEKVRGISLEEYMNVADDPTRMDALAIKYGFTDTERQYYEQLAQDKQAVQLQAFDAMAFQYFQGDAFHGDPHAGNILMPVEGGMTFIDSGSIGESNPKSRKNLRQFFIGFALKRPPDLRAAVQTFVPGIKGAQLDTIATIVQSELNDSDKMKRILQAATEGGQTLDPVFDKFLKSFATGAYLMKGLKDDDIRTVVGAYTQGEKGSLTSMAAIAAARTVREEPQSFMGRLLQRFFKKPNAKSKE